MFITRSKSKERVSYDLKCFKNLQLLFSNIFFAFFAGKFDLVLCEENLSIILDQF